MKRKPYQKVKHPDAPEGYTRVPESVYKDCELTPAAKCVYAVLARTTWQGNVVKMGQRLIAKTLNLSTVTVNHCIAALIARGHIVQAKPGRGLRSTYHLTSSVFGTKAQTGKTEIVSTPSGGRRHVGASPDARTA